jgi:hypothetical protein
MVQYREAIASRYDFTTANVEFSDGADHADTTAEDWKLTFKR